MTLRILGLAVIATLVATSAQAAGGTCRSYVKMPISVALSTGKAFAVASNRVAVQPNRLRGELGPHQFVYLPVWSRACRERVVANRRGRPNRR